MAPEPKNVCSCLCAFIAAICLIIGIVSSMPLWEMNRYSEYTCNVVSIDRPLIKPCNDTHQWTECSCGRYCTSYNACINIKVTLIEDNDEKIYNLYRSPGKVNTPCTYYDRKCNKHFVDEESHIQSQLDLSNSIYNEYNNNTIECWTNNDRKHVLIENYNNTEIIILVSILIGIGVIALCVALCTCEQFRDCIF